MEWVETTAKTVEEAKNRALDQLGVAEDDAEIVVLDEPRPGLFGRVRGEARVRARVRPTTPRPKLDRRDRKKKDHREARTGAAAGAATDDDAGRDDEADDRTTCSPERSTRGGRGGRGRGARTGSSPERSTSTTSPTSTTSAEPDAFDAAFADTTGGPIPSDGADDGSGDEMGDEAGEARGVNAASSAARRRSRGRRGGQRPRGGAPEAGTTGPDDEIDETDGADEIDRPSGGASNSDRPVHTGDKEDMVDAAQVGEEARVFVQGVVDAFGLTGTTAVHQDGDDLEITVDGSDLGLLVGPRGSTLQALQELTRVAAQRRLGDHDTRLRVDVGGYRVRRREALSRFAHQVAAQVVADGVAKRLEPMSSADRKVIHDALSGLDGVVTRSEGDDPRRCVVIAPVSSGSPAESGESGESAWSAESDA